MNNVKNIFQAASALTDITSNFTFPNHRFNRNAPASPPHHKGGRSRLGRAPARVKVRGDGRRAREVGG
ncbi:MAG: hypothetical protein IBX40_02030 [Methanosarcinales archaeon]|nr:hypothetical protein [Methanosarcinales archaeon]